MQYPFIVQDTANDLYNKNWRVMPSHPDVQSAMWASASAAPSLRDLNWMNNEIQKLTNNRVRKIFIIDLREESHGYLNGQAINLTMPNNWVNRGKNYDDVIKDENDWLASLSQKRFAEVHTNLDFDSYDASSSKEIVAIESIQNEKDVVESLGLNYFRITVSDHCAPHDVDVDRFLNFVDNLDDDSWLHFHCRGGAGRSSTFLSIYYMLKHANEISFDSIINMHKTVQPYYDLTTGSFVNTHLIHCYQERYQFLKRFYEFAQARLNHHPQTWSEWRANSVPADGMWLDSCRRDANMGSQNNNRKQINK
jgi:protein-tyrosine phosphatase